MFFFLESLMDIDFTCKLVLHRILFDVSVKLVYTRKASLQVYTYDAYPLSLNHLCRMVSFF
jgi:hypothetical protein